MISNHSIDVEAERRLFEAAARELEIPDNSVVAFKLWLAAKRSIPVPANTGTIDTPEFKFLAEFWAGKAHSSQAMVREGFREAWTALIAHIDARLNAATEAK